MVIAGKSSISARLLEQSTSTVETLHPVRGEDRGGVKCIKMPEFPAMGEREESLARVSTAHPVIRGAAGV
jgi:hypothetical protein